MYPQLDGPLDQELGGRDTPVGGLLQQDWVVSMHSKFVALLSLSAGGSNTSRRSELSALRMSIKRMEDLIQPRMVAEISRLQVERMEEGRVGEEASCKLGDAGRDMLSVIWNSGLTTRDEISLLGRLRHAACIIIHWQIGNTCGFLEH